MVAGPESLAKKGRVAAGWRQQKTKLLKCVMRKVILLALMTFALAGAAVQKASAGIVVGASFGVPVGPAYYSGYYNSGYSGCYSYPYRPTYYGYGYSYCPPPVVYAPPVYVAPPVVSFRFGYGGGYYHGGYRHGGYYHGGYRGHHGHR